jgi:hypothetical protein
MVINSDRQNKKSFEERAFDFQHKLFSEDRNLKPGFVPRALQNYIYSTHESAAHEVEMYSLMIEENYFYTNTLIYWKYIYYSFF